MKRIALRNKGGLKIVGELKTVGYRKIALLVHGFTNDRSSNGRFDSLSEALNNKDYDTIAIDLSGCGESDDAPITIENHMDDLRTFIDYADECGYDSIILIGNSFGTLACLRCYQKDIDTMILIGALTDKMDYDWEEYFSKDKLVELEMNGSFKLDNERKHIITQQTLNDFIEIDQKELTSMVKCPVLIIHGNNNEDTEELQLLDNSRRALISLPKGSRLDVIEGGKHGLRGHWDQVISLSCEWLEDLT